MIRSAIAIFSRVERRAFVAVEGAEGAGATRLQREVVHGEVVDGETRKTSIEVSNPAISSRLWKDRILNSLVNLTETNLVVYQVL